MMGLDKLKWVMQHLWSVKDKRDIVTLKQLRLSIYQGIGTDKRTVKDAIKQLIDLGWVKRLNRHQFKIEHEFMTEDF